MTIFQLPVFAYACIKEHLSKIKALKEKHETTLLISIVITVVISPILMLIYGLFNLYKWIINDILTKRHGEEYRGLLKGIDAICASETNCVPFFLTYLEYLGTPEELMQNVLRQTENSMKSKHEKLFYLHKKYMGYHYYVKAPHMKPNDFIKTMDTFDEVIDKKSIHKILMKYDNAPLPFNNEALFQVVVGLENIVYELEPENQNIYPIIYRVHHSLGDGRSCLNLLKGVFSDEPKPVVKNVNGIHSNEEIELKPKKYFDEIKNLFANAKIKSIPGSVQDDNILRGYNMEQMKHFAWFCDESTDYMDKIRKIRKTFIGVSFLDVVNASLATSLYDFYKKNSKEIPESIGAGVVLTPTITTFRNYGEGDFVLENKFSAAYFKFPLATELEHSNKLIGRLKYLTKEYDDVKKSYDVQLNYWLSETVVSTIPYPIFSFLLNKTVHLTLGVSSLPGCDEATFFGGSVVKDLMLMPPNSTGTAIHAFVYTYKGHLRVGLVVDRSVIANFDEVQEIIDNWINYIAELSRCCDQEC